MCSEVIMIFTKEQLNSIKEKVDYFEFYKQYLPELKRTGSNRAFSPCCFHSETKPSLCISLDCGIWRCFGGCNTYGDIFKFYQKFFNVSFTEAVQAIAKMYDVELVISDEERERYEYQQSLYNVNEIMCRKFEETLEGNNEAWNYLTKIRGLSPKIIKQFRLGAGIKGLPEKESLKKLGLIKYSEQQKRWKPSLGSFRVIFPRFDESGHIVSFTGRDYKGIENAPKYLHLVNTDIYEKSHVIYGLYQAKKYIQRYNKVICCEGEGDMLKCYQKGIVNAVALSGLNASDEQINLLKKYTNNFYICVEDGAILKRSQDSHTGKYISSLDKLYNKIKENIPYANVYIIDLRKPDGSKCDPDMYLTDHTREDFEKLIQDAKVYNEYIINSKLVGVNPKNIEEKTACINILIPMLANIPNFLTRKQYIELVSNKLLIPENDIYRKVKIYVEKQDRIETENITWDSRPVFVQKMLLSMCFAPNFNNFSTASNILFLAQDYMEPFYKNMLNNFILPYIKQQDNVEHTDFKPFFDDLMYNDKVNDVERETLTDIYMKTEQLEDFTQDDVQELIEEQINILKQYKYTTVDLSENELAGIDI